MKDKQEEHLQELHLFHSFVLDKKYRAGAKKHKNDLLSLTPRQLLEEALEENIDQYVYLVTALKKL
jgi:hypothetical protein